MSRPFAGYVEQLVSEFGQRDAPFSTDMQDLLTLKSVLDDVVAELAAPSGKFANRLRDPLSARDLDMLTIDKNLYGTGWDIVKHRAAELADTAGLYKIGTFANDMRDLLQTINMTALGDWSRQDKINIVELESAIAENKRPQNVRDGLARFLESTVRDAHMSNERLLKRLATEDVSMVALVAAAANAGHASGQIPNVRQFLSLAVRPAKLFRALTSKTVASDLWSRHAPSLQTPPEDDIKSAAAARAGAGAASFGMGPGLGLGASAPARAPAPSRGDFKSSAPPAASDFAFGAPSASGRGGGGRGMMSEEDQIQQAIAQSLLFQSEDDLALQEALAASAAAARAQPASRRAPGAGAGAGEFKMDFDFGGGQQQEGELKRTAARSARFRENLEADPTPSPGFEDFPTYSEGLVAHKIEAENARGILEELLDMREGTFETAQEERERLDEDIADLQERLLPTRADASSPFVSLYAVLLSTWPDVHPKLRGVSASDPAVQEFAATIANGVLPILQHVRRDADSIGFGLYNRALELAEAQERAEEARSRRRPPPLQLGRGQRADDFSRTIATPRVLTISTPTPGGA